MIRSRAAALASILLLAAFVVLAAVAAGDGTLAGDEPLLDAVQRASFPGATTLAAAGYWIGLGVVVTPVGVLAAAALAARGDRGAAALLLAAVAIRALNPLLKALIASPRPDASQARLLEDAGGMGFPSGHTLNAALVYGAFALLAAGHLSRHRRRALTILVLLAIAVTAWSRVFRGAHWPSDVLGAALLAGAGLWALQAVRVALRERGCGRAVSGRRNESGI